MKFRDTFFKYTVLKKLSWTKAVEGDRNRHLRKVSSLKYSNKYSYVSLLSDEGFTPILYAAIWKRFVPGNITLDITKTRLFKYTENFTTKKWQFFRQKILIFFIFLLKT